MNELILRIRSWVILLFLLLLGLFPFNEGPFVLLKIVAIWLPGRWVYAIGNKAFDLLETGIKPGKPLRQLFQIAGIAYLLLPLLDYLLLGVWSPETGMLVSSVFFLLIALCFLFLCGFAAFVFSAWRRQQSLEASGINYFLLLFFFPAGMIVLSGKVRQLALAE